MRAICALVAMLSAGCSMLGHQKVEGWPSLAIVEHYVPHAEMRDRCARYVGFGAMAEACAEFNLVARQCHIWYSADFPPQDWIKQHERLHCAGYDHVGSSGMQTFLRAHLATQPAAVGASR